MLEHSDSSQELKCLRKIEKMLKNNCPILKYYLQNKDSLSSNQLMDPYRISCLPYHLSQYPTIEGRTDLYLRQKSTKIPNNSIPI